MSEIKVKIIGATESTEDFLDRLGIETESNTTYLVDENEEKTELIFVLNSCQVKYMPGKYEKITVVLDDASSNFIKLIEKKFYSQKIEKILKVDTISLKLTPEQKANLISSVKQNDYLDIVVKFNGVWKMNGKKYVSLKLMQYKQSQNVTKESIDYFEK